MRTYFLAAAILLATGSHAADLTHTYSFSAGLADSTGTVDLQGNGGGIGGGRYFFGPNQGLTLADGLTDPTTYSIEMSVRFDSLTFYSKLIDFAGLTQDDGVYLRNGELIGYPQTSSAQTTLNLDTDYVVVLTRDTDGIARGYVDGLPQFTIGGSENLVAADNLLNFFMDDTFTVQTETPTGSIDYLRIYDGALTDQEVAALSPARPQILGDTIFGQMDIGNSGINLFDANSNDPLATIVVEPGIEYAYDGLFFRFEADIEQNRVTLKMINTHNDSVGTASFRVALSDLDYETGIVDLVVITDTYAGGATSIQYTDSSIEVLLPNVSFLPGETRELVLDIITEELDDSDADGVYDTSDNCLLVKNPGQQDGDLDGYGNLCDADLNNDCAINVVDLGIMRSVFFEFDQAADLNLDGVVNVVDLGILRSQFFGEPGPSAQTIECDSSVFTYGENVPWLGTTVMDFETGEWGGLENDVFFQRLTASESAFSPLNGSLIAHIGRTRPNQLDCAIAPLAADAINFANVALDDWFCVRTDEGRLSRFQISAASALPVNLAQNIEINFVTWQ